MNQPIISYKDILVFSVQLLNNYKHKYPIYLHTENLILTFVLSELIQRTEHRHTPIHSRSHSG